MIQVCPAVLLVCKNFIKGLASAQIAGCITVYWEMALCMNKLKPDKHG